MSNSANKQRHPEHNKPSAQPTPRNQGQRTPDSRSDRESQVGSSNQTRIRRRDVGQPVHLR